MPVVRDGVMEGDSARFNVPYIRTLVRYQKSCTTEFYVFAGGKKTFMVVTKLLLLDHSGSSE